MATLCLSFILLGHAGMTIAGESEKTNDNLHPFGYDFFAGLASVSPGTSETVPADYRLGPGDKLRIRYWTPVINEVSHELAVNRNGVISIPDIGEIQVSGLTQAEFKRRLSDRLREELRDPSSSAELIEPRSLTVFVSGAAARPGRYTVSALSDMFDVICIAGGPSPDGSMREIVLKRRGKTVSVLDTYKLLLDGARDAGGVLQDGDIIFIPITGPRVAVTGQVIRSALYEVRDGTTVADALRMAGGVKSSAYPRILRLQRVENGRRVERTLDAGALLADSRHADNIAVKGGDILSMEEASDLVTRRVEIRGNVEFPGYYSIARTPTARSLMAEARLLPGTYQARADILRTLEDGTPVIIPLALKKLMDNAADDIPLNDMDQVVVYRTDEKIIVPLISIEGAVKHPASYRLAEGMRISDLLFAAGGLLPEAAGDAAHLYRRTGPDAYRIVRLAPAAIALGQSKDNCVLEDGDRLVVYNQRDIACEPEKVRIIGEVRRPGEYRVYEGLTLYDLILQAGGPTVYAAGTVEAAMSLPDVKGGAARAEIKVLSLNDVTRGAGRDLPVTSGMLVSLPKRSDNSAEPRSVELRGRFRLPGTYALLYDGETLESLMSRAGGFMDDADPFGVSIARRKEQMLSVAGGEQLKAVLESMDRVLPSMAAGSGKLLEGGTAVLDREAPLTALSGLALSKTSEKVLLVSPRRLSDHASGNRISIDLENRETYLKRLGQMRLSNGDVVEAPRRSDVVHVLGAVMAPGPVLYQSASSIADYVSRAGGPAADADMERAVIVKV
ncbi:MAG: SLBB domain-containing protein, partial [bacterium]|nr:SLBB domain-containing protein [bacterium]